jgi:hypothetical protein
MVDGLCDPRYAIVYLFTTGLQNLLDAVSANESRPLIAPLDIWMHVIPRGAGCASSVIQ